MRTCRKAPYTTSSSSSDDLAPVTESKVAQNGETGWLRVDYRVRRWNVSYHIPSQTASVKGFLTTQPMSLQQVLLDTCEEEKRQESEKFTWNVRHIARQTIGSDPPPVHATSVWHAQEQQVGSKQPALAHTHLLRPPPDFLARLLCESSVEDASYRREQSIATGISTTFTVRYRPPTHTVQYRTGSSYRCTVQASN